MAPRRHPALPALVLLALSAIVAAGLAGCGSKATGTLRPDAPPETFLFVQGAVDVVNHRVHLFWNGTDPDGEVAAFDIRMINSIVPAETAWTRMETDSANAYDSVFTVYAPEGFTSARFDVRAVDATGQVDPSPATQTFTFSNDAPVCTITSAPGGNDTTYGSVTVSWKIDDPDGGGPGLRTRVWLGGAAPDSTTGTTFTVPGHRFFQNGAWIAGRCSLYLQAVDDGGRPGPVTSTNWIVRSPGTVLVNGRAKLLVIDDVPATAVNNYSVDTLYSNTLARNLPAGSYSVLRLQFMNPFRSAQDVTQTFQQFEGVVWYRGYQTVPAEVLQAYQDAVGEYTQTGGRLYLETLYAFPGYRSEGWVSPDWLDRYFGGSRMVMAQQTTLNPPDSTVGWGNTRNGRMRSSLFADTLNFSLTVPGITGSTPGLRAFAVPDTQTVALWALPGALSPQNTEQLPVALNARQPGGGRMMLVTFPVAAGNVQQKSRMTARLLFDPVNGLLAP